MNATDTFQQHRPRLSALAYRLLGSRSDAEDLVQDAWLRWHQADRADIRDPEAWLVTATTRLGIDRLRAARSQRETYIGPWLPEPERIDDAPGPAQLTERTQQVSLAFLAVLERLGPEERAAWLLREAFDYDYAQIAALLEQSEANCRQMVHRAKQRLEAGRPRFEVRPDKHRSLLERFMQAARDGDRQAIGALLHADARLTSDGGGKAIAVRRPLFGAERIGRLFWAVWRRHDPLLEWRMGMVNGEPAILRYREGVLLGVMVAVSDGERILELLTVANPDKLGAAATAVTDPVAAPSW
ncbi:RNA polymerase sigma-70 factor [Xanthomonas sp. XNM01]|uniref:RNA polymerase sigma-70 factor n=1 Tax=Xanthomonas sp. XNM01 TaxID=2769289 RepID=UPI00177BA3DA|nr:RNA polymerase sigma-70 factor [Xanthomonas sp. XNM01]MBD9369147.1 RNA polymerase sigma-70 factor [Xanthomonas sp. XNM01]